MTFSSPPVHTMHHAYRIGQISGQTGRMRRVGRYGRDESGEKDTNPVLELCRGRREKRECLKRTRLSYKPPFVRVDTEINVDTHSTVNQL
jgi:hypothetical protein